MDNSVFAQKVAKRMQARSEELGVTQADIHRKTGAAKSTVSAWFSGRAMPRGEYINKLCKVLRCTQDWLMDGKGSPLSNSESAFVDSLPASWETSEFEEVKGKLVRLPLLAAPGELNYDDNLVVHSLVCTLASSPAALAWIKVSSRSGEPTVALGDSLVIDTSANTVTESGGFYLVAHVGGFNVHQIFIELDGSWSVVDTQRGSKSTVAPGQQENVRICGRAVWRCGAIN
jgi:transcriptional regulator with XRE-family HTH domain